MILNEAEKAINNRMSLHGTPEVSFYDIARLWGVYLDCFITAKDVANMMILLKVGRAKNRTTNKDHYIDIAGYAAIAGDRL